MDAGHTLAAWASVPNAAGASCAAERVRTPSAPGRSPHDTGRRRRGVVVGFGSVQARAQGAHDGTGCVTGTRRICAFRAQAYATRCLLGAVRDPQQPREVAAGVTALCRGGAGLGATQLWSLQTCGLNAVQCHPYEVPKALGLVETEVGWWLRGAGRRGEPEDVVFNEDSSGPGRWHGPGAGGRWQPPERASHHRRAHGERLTWQTSRRTPAPQPERRSCVRGRCAPLPHRGGRAVGGWKNRRRGGGRGDGFPYLSFIE